jgi:ribose-phosphate pyrophosphokinase
MDLAVIILAAGKGTRMASDLAKVLHPLCGRPLISWVLETVGELQPQRTVVVVGHQAERVEAEVQEVFPHVEFVNQGEMLGTGHAVRKVEPTLSNFEGDIIVTCGDAPLIEASTLRQLVELRHRNNAACTMMVAKLDEPGSYGRVVCENEEAGASSRVIKIVEAKDAGPEIQAIKTVNAGTYCFDSRLLWSQLARITNTNKSGEYYLTDVIGLLTESERRVDAVFVDEREMTGVNTKQELEELEAELKAEQAARAEVGAEVTAAPGVAQPGALLNGAATTEHAATAPDTSVATATARNTATPAPPSISIAGAEQRVQSRIQAQQPLPGLASPIRVFTGNANRPLAQEIADCLGMPLGSMIITRFADGEMRCAINESIRGTDVFIIQPTCAPVNDTLMELLIMCDAFKRASARRIVPIMPYFGYARQDKKVRPREPITAKLIADLITLAGADRLFAIDLHADQIQGFFDIPVDHLPANPIIADYLISKKIYDSHVTVVSPDVGGVGRARILAERLGADLAIVAKRRPEPGKVAIIDVIGDVENQTCVLIDDLVDSAGTFVAAAEELAQRGARAIYGCATHAVLSGDAVRRIEDSVIKEVIVTNTIPIRSDLMIPKITVLSVAKVCAEAILRIHTDDSVSTMFESWSQ